MLDKQNGEKKTIGNGTLITTNGWLSFVVVVVTTIEARGENPGSFSDR